MNIPMGAKTKVTVHPVVTTSSGKTYDFGPTPGGMFVGFKTWLRNRKIAKYCKERIKELDNPRDIEHFEEYLRSMK